MAAALVLAAAVGPALAAGGAWTAEIQVVDIVPVKGDGTLTPASPVGVGPHVIDFQDNVTGAVGLRRTVHDRVSVGLTLSVGSHDLELDVPGAGTIALGDADLTLLQIEALFEIDSWGSGSLSVGPVLALSRFDDVAVSASARARADVQRATLDDDLLFGVEFRLVTPIGGSGLAFTSTLRYLVGGPQLDVFTTASGAAPAGSGTADFDPLLVGFGLAYSF
ncbi:MAG: hypothetical protein D6718_06875 [Acidobacteria bacterium]|nr:MAG: hypothetical protein D6718_06875 [Acidobacteriota bacterium]